MTQSKSDQVDTSPSDFPDASDECFIKFDQSEYIPLNLRAVEALRAKYGIPRDVEFLRTAQSYGVTDGELRSVYLHS